MKTSTLKNKLFKRALITLLLLGFIIPMAIVSSAPTFEISPAEPKPLSDVDLIVNTDDDTIDEVYVIYQECESDTLCGLPINVSLSKSSTNIFTTTITLERNKATYMQLNKIITHSDSGYSEYEQITKYYLDTSTPSNGNGGNGNGDSDDTPGFEFAIFALSIIFISFILYRRNR